MKEITKYWVIECPAWGTLYATGTEAQAEEWRIHKANWEGSIARKRQATQQEIAGRKYRDLTGLL